jgi:heptosyltransferase I
MSAGNSRLERILIVRLGAMGDVIHALPAVKALREAFPQASIGWLIEERWAELLCAAGAPRHGPRSPQRSVVDQIHAVNLKEWRGSLLSIHTIQQIAKAWNDVRAAQYDVAIDLQGAIRSAFLARCSGARVIYGAAQPWETPASLWYTRRVITRGSHVVDQNLSILEAVTGQTRRNPRVELPHDLEVEARTAEGLKLHGVTDFAILNPGAGWGAKRWPAERYGEVARRLAEALICPLVNCGPGEEDLFREVLTASGGRARPTRGSLTGLIALMRRARLFIGGDTGPLHLAAALDVPVVGVFGPTDPTRNGPYGTPSIVLRSSSSSTTHTRNQQADAGLLEITAEEVAAAAFRLLADDPAQGARQNAHG